MHSTFESAGVFGGLSRLYKQLKIDFAWEVERSLGVLPRWIFSDDFDHAATTCAALPLVQIMELVHTQRRMRRLILAKKHKDKDAEDDDDDEPENPDAQESIQPEFAHVHLPSATTMHPRQLAAIVRLCFGELMEAFGEYKACRLCAAHEVPIGARQQEDFARLCEDSYLAAVWTSSHAEYLLILQDLLKVNDGKTASATSHVTREDTDAQGPLSVEELMVSPPELYLIACASNGLDLTALYERYYAPKSCAKGAQSLLAVLLRATNAGSRGWESTLNTALADSDGALRVCTHGLTVALTGMHSCIHPAARRGWQTRLAITKTWRMQSPSSDLKTIAMQCPTPIKEIIRLYLATLLAEDAATLQALSLSHQPAGQLSIPPRSLAPTCLQCAMHSFMDVGESFLNEPVQDVEDVCVRLLSHLTSEPRSRKKTVTRPMPKMLTTGGNTTQTLNYCWSWLGGRSGTLHAPAVPTATVVAGLLSASFRAEFIPFWLHAQSYHHRASRLDEAQYQAFHSNSSAHQMCAELPSHVVLRVQRLALTVDNATLLGVVEASKLLGIKLPCVARGGNGGGGASCRRRGSTTATATATATAPATAPAPAPVLPKPPDKDKPGEASEEEEEEEEEAQSEQENDKEEKAENDDVATSTSTSKAIQESEALVLGMSAFDAAVMITFAKICALRIQMLSYDLGPDTRKRQAAAICERLLWPTLEGESFEEAVRRLPEHCTHVFACSECRRVVNACQNGSGKDVPFNEVMRGAFRTIRAPFLCDVGWPFALLPLTDWPLSQHVEDRRRARRGPHALRQAVVGRAPHGGGAGGCGQHARGRGQGSLRHPAAASRPEAVLDRERRPTTPRMPQGDAARHGLGRRQAPAGHQELLRATPVGHRVRRRPTCQDPGFGEGAANIWRVARPVRLLWLSRVDRADESLLGSAVLHAVRLCDVAHERDRGRADRQLPKATASRLPFLRKTATGGWQQQIQDGERARGHGRTQRDGAASASHVLLLSEPLPLVARERA